MREFQCIGAQTRYTYIPGPVREPVVRGGREAIEYRDREAVVIGEHPTPVPDDVAEELVRLREYGTHIIEVTAVPAVLAVAGVLAQAAPSETAPAAKAAPMDTAQAIQYLVENGVSAEEMLDKEGKPSAPKIRAAAKRHNLVLPQ